MTAALLVMAALGAWFLLPHQAARVLILASPMESRGQDLGGGMELLIKDHLEILAGATVRYVDGIPAPNELRSLPPDTWILRFQGRRSGDQLAFNSEWNSVGRLLTGRPWLLDMAPPEEPQEVFHQFVHRWPLGVHFLKGKDLLPRDPAHFWTLLEILSVQDDQMATEYLASAQALAEVEPQCATAWTELGDHLYRSLWVHPEASGVGLNSITHQAFQRAQALVPGHPRAAFLGSLMLTDTGNQRVALQTLQKALKLRPGIPDLYLGLAYAGRTAGLLEGARRALTRREALFVPGTPPSPWLVETTYLYLGDLKAFRQNLMDMKNSRMDASVLFYQGYLDLLEHHREKALESFQAGSGDAIVPVPFRDLCRAYQAYLKGTPAQGLTLLRKVDEVRGRLHIPDGEWTFKEAEAYALLGDSDAAMDAATRAFAQGFSCATWYEKSPFLALARSHPRWATLLRNVRERQAVLELSFPPRTFTP
jgi:hypothetical protein